MEPFRRIESAAIPLDHDNVDTDVITPAGRIMEGIESMIAHAFEPLRFLSDGSPDPQFPFNDPAFDGAEILVAGRNFGCGSSRETAVWAIAGLGIRCVIAASFGDIFFANCFKNGLLPIVLREQEVRRIMAAAVPAALFSVDLEACRIGLPDGSVVAFPISGIRREALLHGLDDLGLALRRRDAIEAFAARDRAARPWIYEKCQSDDLRKA
jgi:3-isopropylmalate/(R)-2-methylmalate dehydratase small subunit